VRIVWLSFLTLLSYYRRHPLQAAFLSLGLVTGVALWSAVQLINGHARASYSEADQLLGAQAKYWVRATVDQGVVPADYNRLRRLGFTQIYPVLEVGRETATGQRIQIIATDLLALGGAGGSSSIDAANPFSAESWLPFIQAPYQAWYSSDLAKQLGVTEGDRLPLQNGLTLPPAKLQTQPQQGARVFMDVGAAMSVLAVSHFSYLGVGQLTAAEVDRLQRELPRHLELVKNQQALDLAQLTTSLHTNLTALGLLSFVVGMFIVFNAVRFSLVSRQATIATLRELGVGGGVIATAISLESFVWSVLGAGLGVPLGAALAEVMLPAVATSLESLYGANLQAQLAVEPGFFLKAWLLTLPGVLLALAMPLWQAVSALTAVYRRSRFDANQLKQAVLVSAAVGLGLWVMAAAMFSFVTTVELGFLLIALVMLGGALILPVLLYGVSVGVARLLGDNVLLFRWAIRDALLQLPYLRIALMALLLTLVANLGVTLLVGSFRLALTDWLEGRLSADIYVAAEVAELSNQPWLKALHVRYGLDTRFMNRPATIYAVDEDAPDVVAVGLAKAIPNGFALWQRAEASASGATPVLANEQLHYLAGVTLGEEITLMDQRFQVVGFRHDYGNVDFALWLPTKVAKARFANLPSRGTAIWVQPGEMQAARAGLLAVGLEPGQWLEQERVKAISFQVFDRTFAITSALNTLTLVVAGIALFAALMALHQGRLMDYGQWRALGLRWSEFLLVLGLPLIAMVLLTLLVALPLSYALSWLLIHQLNVIAFGWTMPLLWSWQPVCSLGALTLSITVLTLVVSLFITQRHLMLAVRQGRS
jgi:putative ABC transport system permease protein